MDVKNSSLCIFDKPGMQTDVKGNYKVDYYPVSTITAGAPIEFSIDGSSEDYIDVNDITLSLKLKVLKSDGTDITAADKVGLNNLPISTLFQDVALSISDTQIEGGQQNYPYLGYFMTMLQFHPAAQDSHMQTLGWYKDESGKFDDDSNSGFVSRKKLIEGSKSFQLIGPLFLDYMRQERYLISNTNLRIKLIPSKPEFALNAFGAATSFKIQFEEVILQVSRAEMNPSVINGHATGMKRQNAHYPITHTDLITFTIPKGQKSYIKDRLFPDQSPKLIAIAMVENEAYNGSIKKNPFNFQHFDLSKIALYREGRSIPGAPLTPNFDEGMYLHSYVQTMETMGYYNTDDTNGLTPDEFANGYTIYAYDLTGDKNISNTHRQGHLSNNLRLELYFAKDLPSTVNVLIWACFDSYIEITQLRDVITAYTH